MQDSIAYSYVYTICLLCTGQIPSVLPSAEFPQLKTIQRAQSLKSGHPVKDQRLGQQNGQGCTPVALLRPGFCLCRFRRDLRSGCNVYVGVSDSLMDFCHFSRRRLVN